MAHMFIHQPHTYMLSSEWIVNLSISYKYYFAIYACISYSELFHKVSVLYSLLILSVHPWRIEYQFCSDKIKSEVYFLVQLAPEYRI